jgi:hypothetical protein
MMSLMSPRGSREYQGSHFGKHFGSDDPDGSRQPSVSRQINPRTLLSSATLGKLPRIQFQQIRSVCSEGTIS